MISKSIPGFCFVDPTNKETVNIRFTSVNVVGEPRRIRALWTPELAQDVAAFHNIDAEAELTALLTENLRNEIDQQILQDLALPIARRVAAQTIGLDLVGVRPLELPRGLLEFLDYNQEDNFMALPNEEGWYTKGIFESILIKIDMLPFKFIPPTRRRRGPRRI